MRPMRKILIVGGGSSGWMTAIFLKKYLPETEITLIESSDIPIIGVGESTNVTMGYFQRLAGLTNEKAFMRAVNGAYKIGIRFENFNRLGGVFFHPFGRSKIKSQGPLFNSAAETAYPTYQVAQQTTEFSKKLDYSYQIDAGLYGQYLKTECKARGVRHVVDKVKKIVLSTHKAQNIDHIEAEKSGDLKADLYVDCTGFRSLLLTETLKEPFVSAQKYLLNDRAIAARIPYANKQKELRTYTNCVGQSSGWVWEIPLWSRIGTGYVYSSAFLSPSQAEKEYRRYLGEKRVRDVEFNHISIRTGRNQRAWVGNCVGIGVSFGFLEPLESTGLSLTQVAIGDLTTALTTAESLTTARSQFNRRTTEVFDSANDFIVAHFAITKRQDTPYWKYLANECPIPDSLQLILAEARQGRFTRVDRTLNKFYQGANWNLILAGMGLFDDQARTDFQPRLPETKNLARFLSETIYNESYREPKVSRRAPERLSTWYPTW